MPQVALAERKERAGRLRAAGQRALDHFLAGRVGRDERVLVERGGTGRTEGFAPFRVEGAELAVGSVIAARSDRVADATLCGRAL